MVDLENETLLTVAEAAKRLPTRPSACTVWRWMERGTRGIRLEYIKAGGARLTSVQALQRFADRLTADRTGEKPATDERRKRKADQDLSKAGW